MAPISEMEKRGRVGNSLERIEGVHRALESLEKLVGRLCGTPCASPNPTEESTKEEICLSVLLDEAPKHFEDIRLRIVHAEETLRAGLV